MKRDEAIDNYGHYFEITQSTTIEEFLGAPPPDRHTHRYQTLEEAKSTLLTHLTKSAKNQIRGIKAQFAASEDSLFPWSHNCLSAAEKAGLSAKYNKLTKKINSNFEADITVKALPEDIALPHILGSGAPVWKLYNGDDVVDCEILTVQSVSFEKPEMFRPGTYSVRYALTNNNGQNFTLYDTHAGLPHELKDNRNNPYHDYITDRQTAKERIRAQAQTIAERYQDIIKSLDI